MEGEDALEDFAPLISRLAAGEPDEALDSLAALTARGDKRAFGLIYEHTSDELYHFVHGLCRDDDLTDDVVAGTYLRAWRSARSYRTGTNTYRRWLLRIARNQLTDYWRADRHTVPLNDMDFPQVEEPDGSLAAEESGREVARLMESLTPAQREVVVLRYMNNLSFREIADLLGKREGAVRSQLLRALRHMRKVMHDASS